MRLPEAELALVEREKVLDYLLNRAHRWARAPSVIVLPNRDLKVATGTIVLARIPSLMGYRAQKYKDKPLIIRHLHSYTSSGVYANP